MRKRIGGHIAEVIRGEGCLKEGNENMGICHRVRLGGRGPLLVFLDLEGGAPGRSSSSNRRLRIREDRRGSGAGVGGGVGFVFASWVTVTAKGDGLSPCASRALRIRADRLGWMVVGGVVGFLINVGSSTGGGVAGDRVAADALTFSMASSKRARTWE